MSCGCGCNSCGDTPKVSGTEVTILSGTKPAARHNGPDGASKTGTYIVAASAVAVAAVAFFVTRRS
jgi:hypothetical protein